jgi:D-alanyl-D-alanine carboxypeptidase/D-alanyl-D-alanine-endopeptidase (penicillin-binding protein 4)
MIMMMMRADAMRLVLGCAALGLSGCALLQPAPGLPNEVTQALKRAELPLDSLGIVAYPIDNPRHALRLNEQRPMQPASTMKTVTTVVALDTLGLNSRGKTELLADTALQGDVLPGALYLRGGGDADLDWGALWQLLRQAREQGLREIRGGLVVDRSLFKPARLEAGVPPFDETPEFQYNVIPDALYLNGVL